MANTTVINANATSKVQPSTAPPIEPLKNDLARLYTHVHPILVLSVYALKFRALVADPVQTLLVTLVPLALLQTAFVAICLPPTGGTPSIRNKKPGEKKGKAPGKAEQGLSSKMVVCIPYSRDSILSLRLPILRDGILTA
jgi:phosphatidylinositol glycan class F